MIVVRVVSSIISSGEAGGLRIAGVSFLAIGQQ
jgi:hypothetical protein